MTNKIELPDYSNVVDAVSVLAVESSIPESHGLLAAMFSTGMTIRREAWVDSLLSQKPKNASKDFVNARQTMLKLFDATKAYFEEDDYSFDLLLPNDEELFISRVEALALWCQGYLTGLNLIGISAEKKDLPEDLREALDDVAQIACVDYEQEQVADEESEQNITELIEYVKVMVSLVYAYSQQGELNVDELKH